MKKLLFIFGTRPEAIKLAPLIKRLKNNPKFDTKVLVTAQHRQMLDQVLNLFEIRPDWDLNLMAPNQDLTDITAKILLGCRPILKEFRPDLVLVHGDTTTTLAASLSAFYERIDVAHVEAGLRTYDIFSPYPEELNRQVCTRISKFHFAPTIQSKENLLREGVKESDIVVTGNSGIDALFDALNIIGDSNNGLLGFENKKYVLITGHRRENFGKGFEDLCQAIRTLAQKFKDISFVYPVHLNPNVQEPVKRILSNLENIHLIEPKDYLPFVSLMKNCHLILTDSGGIQEEAPSLGKPVLVMRETTERPEAVESGVVKLVGTDYEKIVNGVSELLENSELYEKMSRSMNPYGDGRASDRIIRFLESCYI